MKFVLWDSIIDKFYKFYFDENRFTKLSHPNLRRRWKDEKNGPWPIPRRGFSERRSIRIWYVYHIFSSDFRPILERALFHTLYEFAPFVAYHDGWRDRFLLQSAFNGNSGVYTHSFYEWITLRYGGIFNFINMNLASKVYM